MGLPKRADIVHELTLPFSQQVVKFRPYYIEEEKSIVTAMNDENKKDVMNNLIQTVKSCLLDKKIDIDKWKSIDFLYFAMTLRAKSKGETMTLKQKCEHCGMTYQFDTNVEECLHIKNEENRELQVELNNNEVIVIEPVSLTYLKNLDKIDDKNPTLSDSYDVVIDNIAQATSKLIIDEKIYVAGKDFTIDELKESQLSRYSEKELNNILEKKEDLIKPILRIETICKNVKCEKPNVVEIEDFFEYII